jgi:hypothetical protein
MRTHTYVTGLLLAFAAVACSQETKDREPDGTGGTGAGTTATGGSGAQGTTTTTTTSGSGGSVSGGAYQLCVDTINQYRATVSVPPLQRWSSAEACVDGEAQSDYEHDTPHYAFGTCGEWAQDECPGWSGPPEQLIVDCLAMMWAEGPGGGHYENMKGDYTQVACGYYQTPDGSWWATQSFQ